MRRRSFLGILPGALVATAAQAPETGREARRRVARKFPERSV